MYEHTIFAIKMIIVGRYLCNFLNKCFPAVYIYFFTPQKKSPVTLRRKLRILQFYFELCMNFLPTAKWNLKKCTLRNDLGNKNRLPIQLKFIFLR